MTVVRLIVDLAAASLFAGAVLAAPDRIRQRPQTHASRKPRKKRQAKRETKAETRKPKGTKAEKERKAEKDSKDEKHNDDEACGHRPQGLDGTSHA